MRFVSTRQADPSATRSFEEVLLAGLAPDGGLYVPADLPQLRAATLEAWAGLDYAALAAEILGVLAGDILSGEEWRQLTGDTYAAFDHPAVAPLKQLDRDSWLLELFHGPTLAFKDYALQLVGRLFDIVLARRQRHITIVGATSGDTGSAAIEACRDRSNLDIFILYPEGRTSEVQRRQMTTVSAANVHTLAVAGSFDDCQDLVKAMFADEAYREHHRLAAVNSINWARLAAQVVYYFWAAFRLGAGHGHRQIDFAVPTGNFGNVYAGHVARLMGLPIRRLVIGTNRNDILWRYLTTGRMEMAAVEPSLSPSMDIQVSSNFERLYHEVTGRDGSLMAEIMAGFRRDGFLPENAAAWQQARRGFDAYRFDDDGIVRTIAEIHRRTGETLDPHSAIAVAAQQASPRVPGVPAVALACAHPAKFPDVVERAIGVRPALPPHLADLTTRKETINRMPNDLTAVRRFVADHARVGAAA